MSFDESASAPCVHVCVLRPKPVKPRALVGQVAGFGENWGPCEGNFLYTKMLLNDIESGAQPLDDLAALPKSLDEIYQRFLLRLDPDWGTRYQPLLAVLAVAREPLTKEQLLQYGDQSARLIGARMSATLVNLSVGVLLQFLDARGAPVVNNTVSSINHCATIWVRPVVAGVSLVHLRTAIAR